MISSSLAHLRSPHDRQPRHSRARRHPPLRRARRHGRTHTRVQPVVEEAARRGEHQVTRLRRRDHVDMGEARGGGDKGRRRDEPNLRALLVSDTLFHPALQICFLTHHPPTQHTHTRTYTHTHTHTPNSCNHTSFASPCSLCHIPAVAYLSTS